jgi:hypothetical protein
MGICIVHSRLVVQDLSYSMISMLNRCQVQTELYFVNR